MLRNYVLLDAMDIVGEAAPVILMVRAEKNKMSWTEYSGSFYAWAPTELLRHATGRLFGFTERDLGRGGRLEKLNRSKKSEFYASDLEATRAGRPEDAVSYVKVAQAKRRQGKQKLMAQGYTPIEAENALQRQAIGQIAGEPFKHVTMSIPFLWRGAALVFPVLVLVLYYGLRCGRSDLVVYVLPVLGLVLFYALVTHFHPRYSDPMVPGAIVGGLVVAHAVARQWLHRVAAAGMARGVCGNPTKAFNKDRRSDTAR